MQPRRHEPTVLLVKMTASPLAVMRELEDEYLILGARHVQAACRMFTQSEPVLVIASELLPFYDLHALRANLPAGALLRLALPGLAAAKIALLVQSVHRVLAVPRHRAS